MVWFLEGLCFMPTFLVIWSSITFILNYLIALGRGDVDLIFPYISDTGVAPPERCIFGLMATISAFAGFATMFARYKFVQKLIEGRVAMSPCLNKAAFVLATLSCIGMCFVATFQETEMRTVHDIGALLFFVCGMIYIILQTIISYKVYPYGSSKCTCHVRAIFSAVALLTVAITIISASFLKTQFHWTPEDQGYKLHVVSAACEWIAAFTFVFFFYTYIQEFKQFTVRVDAQLLEFT
ncbi:DNA damage-regulated autophagy modulator protein 1 [Tachysurus fulvidraco]|uniref:DNA damage-regulated autophagy modulator protein 1 n=1 Tax=Tachysurus fulvidraco TaxID=1234273 RepID=UPI000F4FDC23|nr:DNA damage-regulated autophagy modulator protein 1 [Tachysurus fulvidraco]